MGSMPVGLIAIVLCAVAAVYARLDVAVMVVLLVAVGCARDDGTTVAMSSPAPAGGGRTAAAGASATVVMKTSLGDITIEIYPDKAPITVKSFLDYVEAKHYDGTIFHRVIPSFMIQGGGFSPDMEQKPTGAPIKNEAGNGLKNLPGAIAMARTSVVDSATAQFFINTKANPSLDHRDESAAGFGYAVFGKVVKGMDVVGKIEAVATTSKGPHRDVPVTPVLIESVRRAP